MPRVHLRHRHVLLTGAAGGIGTALAHQLQAAGARLTLSDRTQEGLQALSDALTTRPVALIAADLASADGLDHLQSHLGPSLDLFIHCAGIAPGGAFGRQSAATLDAVLNVNLRAAIHLTHRLLPRLRRSPNAAIAFVASGAGLVAPGGLAAYAASKFGLVGFAEALRAELHPQIGVSVICPPFVRTDIIKNTAELTGSDGASTEALHGLVHRFGLSPERVARAVIDAIQRDRGRVVVGAPSRILLALRTLSPTLADRVNHRVFDLLRARGAF